MSIYSNTLENIEFQRLTHIKLLHKYGKFWRESNDPLIQFITYDFNDKAPENIPARFALSYYNINSISYTEYNLSQSRNALIDELNWQRNIHLFLIKKYGKDYYKYSNDPLLQYITYDFNDDVPDYIGYPLYLTRYKSIYEKYKEREANLKFNQISNKLYQPSNCTDFTEYDIFSHSNNR